jgi:cyclophilin family peptidyl-prolyl cis-trans isomerase
MKRFLVVLLALAWVAPAKAANPVVVMKTSMGTIEIELFEKEAPKTVENFLKYVDDKHYDGTVFHRVIKTFMVQGGGYPKGFAKITTLKEFREKEKKTRAAIKNESANNLSNKRGTIAMARLPEADSATAQFFINVKDNTGLDRANASDGAGYCVFGKVTKGLDIVDKIKDVKTKVLIKDQLGRPQIADVPVDDVVIESVRRK